MDTSAIVKEVKRYIKEENHAISQVLDAPLAETEQLIKMIHSARGRVVFIGVGKSGHIGKKLAATFASTGTPAIFVHGTEALHGDLGMISVDDIVILISNSGETAEVLSVMPNLLKIGSFCVSFTRSHKSALAQLCHLSVEIPVENEAGHLQLAPTNSSTAVLVVGDAIALTLSEMKNFSSSDFGLYHPGGALGKITNK